MTNCIQIKYLLPMWAPRERTNEEWDFWVTNLGINARKTSDPIEYLLRKQLDFMFCRLKN